MAVASALSFAIFLPFLTFEFDPLTSFELLDFPPSSPEDWEATAAELSAEVGVLVADVGFLSPAAGFTCHKVALLVSVLWLKYLF